MRNVKLNVCCVGLLALFMGALSAFASEKNQQASASAMATADRPNILWITLEDTSPHFIGCYGDKNARTPHIDRLAREGVRFTKAFATGPVCSAARSTIITGVKTYKLGSGNHRSEYPIPAFIKGFPVYMQQAGYFTTNCGKRDYNVANADIMSKESWSANGKVGWWTRKDDRPFFSIFNHNDSHQSRTMSWSFEKYEQMVLENLGPEQIIRDDEFSMPPFLKDSPEMRKQFARVYNSIRLTDIRIGQLLKKLEDDGLRDDTILFLYADHGEGIPRAKQNGINLSYQAPFIISIPEKYKHLSPWGTGGVVTDELVSFEDLAPTVISLAGGTVPEHMHGRILMGKNRSKPTDHLVLSSDRCDNGIDLVRAVTDGDWFYARNFMAYMPEANYKSYSEISDIMQQMRKDLAADKLNAFQKSLFVEKEPEFLFNLKNDPWEKVNLANDPAHQKQLKKMRGQLDTEMREARDILFLPEYELELLSKETTPYEFRLDDEKYPFDEIYDAALLSGFRGAAIAEEQIALLRNPNRVVRYWATMGLLAQSKCDLEPFQKQISAVMDDAYAPTALTASVVMWRNFETKKAEEKIKGFCVFENWFINLMAIDYLFYVENRAPFAEAVEAAMERNRTAGVATGENNKARSYIKGASEIFFDLLTQESKEL